MYLNMCVSVFEYLCGCVCVLCMCVGVCVSIIKAEKRE